MTTLPIKSNVLSNNNIFLFKSELTNGKEIRVIGIAENPLFIGKDIAEILGYTDTSQSIREHVDEEDKITCSQAQKSRGVKITPLKLQPQTILINESGLYSLILRSKLENAKKFKRWITSEVLPSIRKSGQYKLQQELLLKDEVIKSIVSEKDMIKKNYSKNT
jgi:prophage antirepressor-like protein